MVLASPLTSQVQHDVHTQAPLLHNIFGRRFALYRGIAYGLILIMLGVIGFTLTDLVRRSGLPLILILAQSQTIILLLTFLVFSLLAGVFAWQTSLRALERRFTRQLVASLQPDAPAGTARSQVLAANLNLLTQGPQALRFKTSEVRTHPTNVPGKTLLVIPLYRRQGAHDHAHQLTMVYVTAVELAQFKNHLARKSRPPVKRVACSRAISPVCTASVSRRWLFVKSQIASITVAGRFKRREERWTSNP